MKIKKSKAIPRPFRLAVLLALALTFGWQTMASAFTLNVVDNDGAPIASGFRWLLEEDNTNQPVLPTPGAAIAPTKSISLDIHKSYSPVAANGSSDTDSADIVPPNPNGRYALSILPYTGYSIGGTTIIGNPGTVTVVVQPLPIPTAQISIFVFEDNAPINNAPDDGEVGLAGAAVTIHDSAGQQMQDIFGNPLGTEYDPTTGNVTLMGNGAVLTDVDGIAHIKNLAPGKYGVIVSPPTGDWIQTNTIEGTRVIDAFVKADEPQTFIEGFGTGFYHVAFGFLNPAELPWAINPPAGTGKITGNLRYNHFARPPLNQGFHIGPPVKDCWIGLNDPVTGEGLYATPCFDGIVSATGVEIPSSFSIPNVPPGTYELVTWDKPLDSLFGTNTVTMPETGDLNLGTILAFRWFGSFIGNVFLDDNENGIREPGEIGLVEQNINIRFRDGTIYQSQPTDINGGYFLEEVFPFFKWLVPEVDFARFKSTGMTTAIDYGGGIPAGFDEADPWGPLPKVPTFDALNPQPQAMDNPYTGNNLSRTETGEVLTTAMHLFLNQTNVIDWGKQTYTGDENGGITGVVMYAVTRAENDPRYAAGEPWEPGIPRVQMNLYLDSNVDGVIDDLDGDGGPTLADVDNYPFDNFPGTEDVDRNSNTIFDPGDAISITTTDSWDDNQPSGCVQDLPIVHGQPIPECADAYGTWNQVRPGVFDGGYAFASYHPGGIASGSNEVAGIPSAQNYIVEATTPPGYLLLKEEDKNVDFGNEHQVSTQVLPPVCVGDDHLVPDNFSFQTDENGIPLPGIAPADLLTTFYAGQTRPLCDRKMVGLSAHENAAADFFFLTEVPKAARAVGFVNNDLSAEFNQGSPNFGEKAAPSWIPVSFKDWKGNEITRVYTDEFGGYNAMLPSTYSVNVPSPSGVSPNMITLVLNDPVMPDGSIDPNYNPDYSVTPWTFQYEAGRTTYLDTPLVPVAAFVNFPEGTLDIEPRDKTPVIASVSGPETATRGFGPLICRENPAVAQIVLTSRGTATVPNPDYRDNDTVNPITIQRDYGFSDTPGQVLLVTHPEDPLNTPIPLTVDQGGWTNETITITLDPTTLDTAQLTNGGVLVVIRGDDGRMTETFITLTVLNDCTGVQVVQPAGVFPATPIQDAIDAATAGDTILVAAGTYYENVIMDKPVNLLGSGGASIIQANPNPSERLTGWHNEVLARLNDDPFQANEAPGIMVLDNATDVPVDFTTATSLIDGFTITGAITGGGIALHQNIQNLTIRNNRLFTNQGTFAGGIAIGAPDTGIDANNDNLLIQGNWIAKNGGIQGGGGIGIYQGATDYVIDRNIIVGNFSRFTGGGINHVGLSNGGTISRNKILFNEIFYGTQLAGAGNGGGINVAGEVVGVEGAGSVLIDSNLIQGNLAGSGLGGGINGYAVDNGSGYSLNIVNNIIANNVAGYRGGGVFLHDVADGSLFYNNTVVNNDTTATAALAFPPNSVVSDPQPAGVAVSALSSDNTAFPAIDMQNNIVLHNRAFHNEPSFNNNAGGLVLNGYWDLGVVNVVADPLGPVPQLNPTSSILTGTTGFDGADYSGNSIDDPAFVHPTSNNLFTATVADEGGNAISVRFTPLYEGSADYHLTNCSLAKDVGIDTAFDYDVDGDPRNPGSFDIGADEFVATQTEATLLTLLSPVGGEVIPTTTTDSTATAYIISWVAPPGVYTTFDLAYSLDGGATWTDIAIEQDATTISCYPWILPQLAQASDQVIVRVTGRDGGGAIIDSVESPAALTVDIASLISPNGGETLIYDPADPTATYQISWQNPYAIDPTDVISLWYRLNGGLWTQIVSNLAGDATSYDWTIPAVTTATTGYEVRLVIADSSFVNRVVDISDETFTIRPAPAIEPAAPPVGPADEPAPGGGVTPPATTGSGVVFQCPGYVEGADSDQDGDGILRADVAGEISSPSSPNQVCLHLAAGDGFTTMADGYPQYMFGFTNVTGIPDADVMNMWDAANPGGMQAMNFPAPLIKVKEGDEVYLTLTNVGMMMRPDLFDPHTVHWHGFPQASSIFDGVPDASIAINMGSSLTYYYKVIEPGTYMYHCHVEATEHMQMGMLGNLYVTPVQDEGPAIGGFNSFAYNDGDGSTGYDQEYHLQIAAFDPDFHDASLGVQPLPFALMDDKYPMINGRGYPDTVNTEVSPDPQNPNPLAVLNPNGYWSQRDSSLITANLGEKVLLRISSLSTTSFHTITVLGVPMQLIGTGSRKLGQANDTDLYRNVNSVTIGGGEAVDVLLDTTGITPGTYFLYVNNLDHLTNNGDDFGGMMTEIRIAP